MAQRFWSEALSPEPLGQWTAVDGGRLRSPPVVLSFGDIVETAPTLLHPAPGVGRGVVKATAKFSRPRLDIKSHEAMDLTR